MKASAVGTPKASVTLVIPAYNEAARLPDTLDELARFTAAGVLDLEVLVVDNASTDDTAAIAIMRSPDFGALDVLQTELRGKGLAVRTGALAARGRVVAFGDADLSWQPADLVRLAGMVCDATPVVVGSREGVGARRLNEPRYRHAMGRVFNRIVQDLAVGGIEDTQCGLKLFRADAARDIFTRQRINGFGFDVEALYLARKLGYGIACVPIRWEHRENSRVRPVRDAMAMLKDVLAVKWYAARGLYGLPGSVPSAPQPALTVLSSQDSLI